MTDIPGLDAEPLEDDGREPCPICGFRAKNLAAHMRRHESARSSNGRSSTPNSRAGRSDRVRLDRPAPTISLAEETDRLVESLATLGSFALPVAPHTGLTIISRAGDREIQPQGAAKPIHKAGIATVVMGYAQRDPRIMRAVVRFNNFMHAGEGMELIMSVGAAVAVDVKAVNPHMAIPLPGAPEGVELRPIEGLIGDVVAQVEAQYGPAPEPEPQPEPSEVPV